MECLNCRYVDIQEYGYKGRLGESIVSCGMCNEINSQMEDCQDHEPMNLPQIEIDKLVERED